MSKYTAKQIAESDDLFDKQIHMERDVELSAVAGAVKNQHHKKKI